VLLAGAASAIVLVAAAGAIAWRNQTETPPPSSSPGATVFPQGGGSPTTTAGIHTVDLPTTGRPTGALVLPYAVDGDYHSAAGSNETGSGGITVDVLRLLPSGNRVVTVTENGLVKMVLEDTKGTAIVELGHFKSRVEANRGGRFAYVDRTDGHLSVRDAAGGREVAALPGVGTDADVVGFAGPAVFYTDNGKTLRWDTTTSRAAGWRPTEMVVFNDSTRTAVGGPPTKCFAVVGVDTPSEATKNLDCQGLELKGITGDGRYAIAWKAPTGPEETRVVLIDVTTGKSAFVVRVPSGSSVVQVGYRTHPVPRALVLSTVTPDGRNRLVGCPTDGTCEILTEPKPTAGDPEAPPPYVISRD
jgi:hypothetical protein